MDGRQNAILRPEQSGFREPHSTTTSFLHFLQQTTSRVICVDFTEAFDQLWHDGLPYKVHQMSCPRELVIFIIEYQKNSMCHIEIQNKMFELILFLLFHWELTQRIPSATHARLFPADLALIINVSPCWHRSEFVSQM